MTDTGSFALLSVLRSVFISQGSPTSMPMTAELPPRTLHIHSMPSGKSECKGRSEKEEAPIRDAQMIEASGRAILRVGKQE